MPKREGLGERPAIMRVNLSLFVDRGRTENPCRELPSQKETPSTSESSKPLTQSPGKASLEDHLRQFYSTREVSSSPSTYYHRGLPYPRVSVGHARKPEQQPIQYRSVSHIQKIYLPCVQIKLGPVASRMRYLIVAYNFKLSELDANSRQIYCRNTHAYGREM